MPEFGNYDFFFHFFMKDITYDNIFHLGSWLKHGDSDVFWLRWKEQNEEQRWSNSYHCLKAFLVEKSHSWERRLYIHKNYIQVSFFIFHIRKKIKFFSNRNVCLIPLLVSLHKENYFKHDNKRWCGNSKVIDQGL